MEFDRTVTGDVEVQTKLSILRRSPLSGLAEASSRLLLEAGRIERLPKQFAITEQGEPPRSLLFLGAGRVKLERVNGDRTLQLGHRGPGQLVGETAIGGLGGASENARVVDEVEALAVPFTAFRRLMQADAPLRAEVTAALVQQRRLTEERLTSLLLDGVEARLVGFLLDAANRWGRPQGAGALITAPFTHADVALLIGSTRETVTLLLGKLKRAGLLAFDRRRVLIPDRERLAQHVASPPAAPALCS